MISALTFEHHATTPIITALHQTAEGLARFDEKSQADAEWALLEMVAEIGIISPLGFAGSVSDLKLLQGACVCAFGATDTLNLYIKPGLHKIQSVACIDTSASDMALAEIILREKYRMTPTMVAVRGALERAMQSADAVLVTTSQKQFQHSTVLDIVDEWWDMTQLPYVQFLFAGWDATMTDKLDEAIAEAGKIADEVALEQMRTALQGAITDDPAHQIHGHYRYMFDDEALSGLNEFYRFAFYHGIHKDIPDISFWQPPAEVASNS